MIKNIIFDFGDIFINLDKTATPNGLKPFGFNGITPALDHLMKTYEKGNCSTGDFISQAQQLFPTATTAELIEAWNAIIKNFPEERLLFIEQLAAEKKYRLFLLSNTNELHINSVIEEMGQDKFDRFKSCFEVFYLSHQMHMRKPDTEIYSFVCEQQQLNPSETLFIDDTLENTKAAEKLGISTWHLSVGLEDITQLFNHI